VYAAIASFVDPKTGMSPSVTADVGSTVLPENIPTRKRLASCIGKSIFTVDRSIKRLEQRGLILVHRHTHPENTKAHAPSQYELLPYRPQPTPIPKQTATVARKRLPISATKRTRIMARDGHRCQKCGATEDLTIDHIQHWSRGGTNADDNLRVLCRSCNSQRSDGSLEGLDS
jgi:DNA-binding transcriptional MocR family regulator